MTKILAGKTALITGAGIGIGAAIAVAYAQEGARVAITYRTHAPAAGLLADLTIDGQAPLVFQLDATQEDSVKALAAELTQAFGKLDILVNNIGGLVKRSPIADMSFALWREVMAVNLDSAFLMTHHLLPILSAKGRVINMASLAGQNGGGPGAAAYAASKAALFGFTRGLAKELAPKGITVNVLAPGFIDDTPFHETFTTPEQKKAAIAAIAVGHVGVPADCASAALWLASEGAGFVTGTVIDINGGQYFA